jgi:hypothetical protein
MERYSEPWIPPSRVLSDLRERLTWHREMGEPFDRAWSDAINGMDGLVEWGLVLTSTREAWESAYELTEPPRPVEALMFAGLEREQRIPDAECWTCGGDIKSRWLSARYCSKACQKAANRRVAA